MQTRQTRAIIWTDYPTAADAAALAELDAEQDADKRAEIAGRIAPATQTRITLSVLSALQFARYQAAITDVRAWIEEEIGADKADNLTWLYGLAWAQMRGALVKIEERTASRTDDSAGAWTEINPPAEWDTPAGYLDSLPYALVDALSALAIELNPQVFATRGALTADDAKKNGGATAA